MTENDPTLTVPIGANAHIDGGPFENFEGEPRPDTAPAEQEALYESLEGGGYHDVSIAVVEDALRNELSASEPFHLNTGDVGDEYTVGTVEVPLVSGHTVSLHRLPGQGTDRVAVLENLAVNEGRRRHFERQLKRHGGTIE